MDGKTVVNQVIGKSTYKPKIAPLKSVLRSMGHGLPFPAQNETIGLQGLGTMINQRQANIAIANVPPSLGGVQATPTEATYVYSGAAAGQPTFDIYTPIEKSQYCKSGYWGMNEGHIQPSFHAGIQPVPALSSAATLAEINGENAWTDCRAYFELTATMIVSEHTPTAWPFASFPNIPTGENVIFAANGNIPQALKDPRNDGATFAGLYTNLIAPLDAN